MNYPEHLTPHHTEIFSYEDGDVIVPKCVITFDKWLGEPVTETFGGKAIVDLHNKPMFAELAIMFHFIFDGWDSRWVETYARGNKEPICLSEWKDDKYKNQVNVPFANDDLMQMIREIAKGNANSFNGCWDVLSYKDGNVLFSESKRRKHDRLRQTQNNWLKAALAYGLKPENFLVVEWDFK
jgi:hypothetical protein